MSRGRLTPAILHLTLVRDKYQVYTPPLISDMDWKGVTLQKHPSFQEGESTELGMGCCAGTAHDSSDE